MERRLYKKVAATSVAMILLVVAASLLVADVDDRYTDWSAPVNLGPPVNSGITDFQASISTDGLSLYFTRGESVGGLGGFDIWVSQRASADAPWGEPQNLGPAINTSANEQKPVLSLDGHQLFFFSDRAGGFGANDLYVSRQHNKRDDFDWQPSVNLGSGVNSSANERAPAHFEDDATGAITLYFASDRPGGRGGDDIYVSTLQPDETFGPAVLVEELSTISRDIGLAIRRDGLESFLASDRQGTFGGLDLWVSTRASTSDPWSSPVNLGETVNSTGFDAGPALSFDGTVLYFQSNRVGTLGPADLWVTRRGKL